MSRTTTSCSRQPPSTLHPKTCPAQAVPLVPQGWYYISFHLFRVTGSSRQHLSTSRVVGSIYALFYGEINCTNKACMFFLSLWTHRALGHKKYCVLRKYTGATKGPRGPTSVTESYWCYAIAGWAGWSKVGAVSFPLWEQRIFWLCFCLERKAQNNAWLQRLLFMLPTEFCIIIRISVPQCKVLLGVEQRSSLRCLSCEVWRTLGHPFAIQQRRRSNFTVEKFKSKGSSGLSFYGLNS